MNHNKPSLRGTVLRLSVFIIFIFAIPLSCEQYDDPLDENWDDDGLDERASGKKSGCENKCKPSCKCGWTEIGCNSDRDCQTGLYCKMRPQLGNRCLKTDTDTDTDSDSQATEVHFHIRVANNVLNPIYVQLYKEDGQPSWISVSRVSNRIWLMERCEIEDCGGSGAVCGAALPHVKDIQGGTDTGRVEFLWDGYMSVIDDVKKCERREPAPPGDYVANFCYGLKVDLDEDASDPASEYGAAGRIVDPICTDVPFTLPTDTDVVHKIYNNNNDNNSSGSAKSNLQVKLNGKWKGVCCNGGELEISGGNCKWKEGGRVLKTKDLRNGNATALDCPENGQNPKDCNCTRSGEPMHGIKANGNVSVKNSLRLGNGAPIYPNSAHETCIDLVGGKLQSRWTNNSCPNWRMLNFY